MPSVEIIVAEIHVPEARSLKEKRRVVKGVIDRIHRRLRISVAETGHQDLHQRCEITAALVLGQAASRSEEIRRLVEQDPTLSVTQWDTEIIDLY